MRRINCLVWVLSVGLLGNAVAASAGIFSKKKTSKSKTTKVVPASTDSVVTKDELVTNYKKFTKGATVTKGLLNTYMTKAGVLYMEIPDSLMNETFLLSNRIAETSNTQDFVAGQMVTRPFMVSFSRNDQTVFMHQLQSQNEVGLNDPIEVAFNRNFVNPILKGFKIMGKSGDNVLIDVSAFFGTNEKSISPLKPDNPLAKLFGGGNVLKGSFVKENSYISSVKSFPLNVEIRSVLSFTTDRDPYTVTVHRSLVLLPKEPMMKRLQDNRVGFFNHDRNLFSSNLDKMHSYMYINRWRLEPKKEDLERYFAGELVEPKKPIVFYIDNAFPEKWRIPVKQGVEDWNTAFEAAGFKNAIKAVDYPTNDPDFDPDDMRYSCIKYAATATANAMGPSHVDPRSGEILVADVIWYHNIVSLLHNWRFTQTAAVDARVRKDVFDDEVMQESMRYVAAHEIGHTLGLMHNMGASYSFPVDSLRSPSFTQKYGTTPSIMDYARNNFVAQPGDLEKGVRLTPPILGVYDEFAINWGYRLVKDVTTPEQERPTLNKWVAAKVSDPMFQFGAQQMMGTIDPTAQTEDLGNDHIKSSNYGISNLKIIMNNYMQWLAKEGDNYEEMGNVYKEITRQYSRHLRHVMPYIGGVRFREIRQGEEQTLAKSYIGKAEQKRALLWLMNEARTYKKWMLPTEMASTLELSPETNDNLVLAVVGCVMSGTALQRIYEGEQMDPANNYKLYDYVDEMIGELFRATIRGEQLTKEEIILQSAGLLLMTRYSGLKTASSASSSKIAVADAEVAYHELMALTQEPSLPCSQTGCKHEANEANDEFYRLNFGLPTLPSFVAAPLMMAQLKRVQTLYKSRMTSSTGMTRTFYDYQLQVIDKLFKSGI